MDFQIDLSGLDDIEDFLKRLPQKLMEGAMVGVNNASLQMEDDAKQNITNNGSVVTGQLRESVHAEEAKRNGMSIDGGIFNNAEHAVFVEMGTGQRGMKSPSPPKTPDDIYHREDWPGMPAQPFLYPALVKVEDEALGIVGAAVKEKLKE